MKPFHWKMLAISVVVFALPPLVFPSIGVLKEGLASYSFGFPFPWISVFFDARGGKAFLVQAFSENHTGFSVSIITAVLDLLIIFLVLHAIVKVFIVGKQHHQKIDPTNPGDSSQTPPEPPPAESAPPEQPATKIPKEPFTVPSDEPDEQSKECSPPVEKTS